MKNSIYLLLAVGIIVTLFSCSKKPDVVNPNSYKVQYYIASADAYITMIMYTDSSGSTQMVSSINDFGGGDSTITVTRKPFIANLKVDVNNTTPVQHQYTLAILVIAGTDTAVKFTPMSVPPNAISSGVVKDTIQ